MPRSAPAVSIIVPVYNSALYLKRALDSIRRQSLKNFEVLLVNDGSTDSSRAILLAYCQKDARFRLIDKKNGGVASARNAGLRAARGEFIAFLDSDDFLAPFYLQRLYRAAIEFDADIACCSFYRYYEQTGRVVPTRFRKLPPGVYNSRNLLKKLILDIRVRFYLWDKLWRRSLFSEHNVTFPDMCFEDAAVAVPLFYYANKVAVTSYPGYYYTQRAGSMISAKSVRNMDDYIKSVALIRNFLEKQGVYLTYRSPVTLHGLAIMICNTVDLAAAHKKEMDWDGFVRNLCASNSALRYYLGQNFAPVSAEKSLPDVLTPVQKRKRRNPRARQ